MHHHWIALSDLVEHAQPLAARQHVVLADHLEPVDRRISLEDFVVVLVAKTEAETEERRLGRTCRTVRKRRHRRIRQSARDVHGNSAGPSSWLQNYHGNGARHTGPRSGSRPELGRSELALGGGALVLGHFREALALTRVLALAGIRGALAGALALAGVGADALAFACGVGRGRNRRTSQQQRGGGGSDSSTRLGHHLHDHLLQKERCTACRLGGRQTAPSDSYGKDGDLVTLQT